MSLRFRFVFALLLPAAIALPQTRLTFQAEMPAPSQAAVLHKPYTAERHMRRERHLPDGTVVTQEFDLTEARDDAGVIATVMHETAAAGQPRQSRLAMHTAIDSEARTILEWNNLSHTAMLIHVPAPPLNLNADKPAPPETIGHRMIDGCLTTGLRTEHQAPGAPSGSATPLRSVTVAWHSDALAMDLERTVTNPGTGTTTWTLLNVRPGEPDPALCHIPAGYTLQDLPAPRQNADQALASSSPPLDPAHLPVMSYAEAMSQLDDRATAPVAAAVLMKMEATDPDLEQKDAAVYAVARKGLALPAAEALAQADVAACEQVLAMPPAQPPAAATLLAEHHLARYWDTLGYTLSREKKDGIRYLLAAWTLDPLAYYGSHLGQQYEHVHVSDEAVAVYREALGEPGGVDMKQLIRDRLNALQGPPQAAAVSVATAQTTHAVADILYVPGQRSKIYFLSGESAVGAAGSAAANASAETWRLPDAGPEAIVRLVAVDCAARCTVTKLPAHLP